MRPAIIALALFYAFAAAALPKDHKTAPPVPDRFVIGRDSFFDSGPPFDYFELLFADTDGGGSSVERVMLTAGYKCTLAPKIEVTRAALKESVLELFGATNPCAIPEKELNRELKRRKHYLVFSGAKVSMQVQCGGQTRIIRSDILDRDMFDPHAGTPEHTAWTMGILGQLDQALGPGAMGKPMMTVPEDSGVSAQPVDSPALREIADGKYDSLFPGTEKLSQIYLSTKKRNSGSTVRLLSASPSQPVLAPLPDYPAIARAASVEGTFTFTVDVQSDGRTANFTAEQGPLFLRAAVEKSSHDWMFSKEAAGQHVVVTVQFALNCPDKN